MTTRRPGQRLKPGTRERGLAMLKAGARPMDVRQELGVSKTTASRWSVLTSKPTKPKARKPKARKPKARKLSAVNYLAKQLEIVAQMIREKLPQLAKFSLTTTADGDAAIEYTVRQVSEVSGTVKL